MSIKVHSYRKWGNTQLQQKISLDHALNKDLMRNAI